MSTKLEDTSQCSPVVATPSDSEAERERSHIWFSDGNVVLQTDSKQYRVHRGVLSLHSTIFKDRFEMSQPEAGLCIEGCPVVDVTDSTEDWDALLPVLYHAQRMYTPYHIIPVESMIAMIRLGHKYDIQSFKEEALEQLKVALPSKEVNWDELFSTDGVVTGVQKFGDFTERHEFKLLQMALDLGIETVLPLAFYTCLRDRAISDIMTGTDEPNGPVHLDQNVKDCLILARETIAKDCKHHIYGWVELEVPPSKSCRSAAHCLQALSRILRFFFRNTIPIKDALDPARFLTVDISELCTSCQNAALDKEEAGRSVIFNKLPSYFGLPGWGELEDFRVA